MRSNCESSRPSWRGPSPTRVVNASGYMTALGGSVLAPDVAAAMVTISKSYLDFPEYKQMAAAHLATLLGVDGVYVTTGAAAAVAIMVAATVAGSDRNRVAQLPVANWEPRRILIAMGHAISFGALVTQMIRLGGGVPVLVGATNGISPADFAVAVNSETAAILYVVSHHTHPMTRLPVESVIEVGRQRGVPVLVDAAAEEDLRRYAMAGADLVAYSGGKAVNGPTSGLVIGAHPWIDACWAQEEGIARSMKVGKETVAGLVAAVGTYEERDRNQVGAARAARTAELKEALRTLPQVEITTEWDSFAPDVERVLIGVRGRQMSGNALYQRLVAGTPPVMPRYVDPAGRNIALDPRALDQDDIPIIRERLATIFNDCAGDPDLQPTQ